MCVRALFTNTEVLYYDTTVKHNPSIVFRNSRPFDTLNQCSSILVHGPDVSLPQHGQLVIKLRRKPQTFYLISFIHHFSL